MGFGYIQASDPKLYGPGLPSSSAPSKSGIRSILRPSVISNQVLVRKLPWGEGFLESFPVYTLPGHTGVHGEVMCFSS